MIWIVCPVAPSYDALEAFISGILLVDDGEGLELGAGAVNLSALFKNGGVVVHGPPGGDHVVWVVGVPETHHFALRLLDWWNVKQN